MPNNFELQLAKFIQDSPYLKSNSIFRWLNPIPENISSEDTDKLLSKLPTEVQDTLILDSQSRDYFNNDIRALQLYVQTMPVKQILSQEEDNDHVEINEFNQFFRENYITNQAYKLSKKQREEYLNQVTENVSWQDYVLQESVKINSTNKIEPNYSIQYFLTNLNPVSRLEYLNQIKEANTENEDSKQIESFNPISDLPELNTLQNSTIQNFQEPITPQIQTETINNTQEKQALQTSSTFSTSLEPEPQKINLKEESLQVNVPQPTIQTRVSIEQQEEVVSQGISQFDQRLQSQVINQNQLSKTDLKPQETTSKRQKNTPNINISASAPQSRRKPLNYAKIVGYSSAAGLSLGTGGLTIFNTLFGS